MPATKFAARRARFQGLGTDQIKGKYNTLPGPNYNVKKIEFLDADMLQAGPIQLDSVSGLTFNGKLYDITIRFRRNGDTLYRVLERRCGELFSFNSMRPGEFNASEARATNDCIARISVVANQPTEGGTNWNQIEFTDRETAFYISIHSGN